MKDILIKENEEQIGLIPLNRNTSYVVKPRIYAGDHTLFTPLIVWQSPHSPCLTHTVKSWEKGSQLE